MQVAAIVAQRSEKVQDYLEANALPFEILLDEDRAVSKAYDVYHRIGLDAWNIARPALFLIDRSGTIRYAFVAERQEDFPEAAEIERELDRLSG